MVIISDLFAFPRKSKEDAAAALAAKKEAAAAAAAAQKEAAAAKLKETQDSIYATKDAASEKITYVQGCSFVSEQQIQDGLGREILHSGKFETMLSLFMKILTTKQSFPFTICIYLQFHWKRVSHQCLIEWGNSSQKLLSSGASNHFWSPATQQSV